jgi:hypothetical protein
MKENHLIRFRRLLYGIIEMSDMNMVYNRHQMYSLDNLEEKLNRLDLRIMIINLYLVHIEYPFDLLDNRMYLFENYMYFHYNRIYLNNLLPIDPVDML